MRYTRVRDPVSPIHNVVEYDNIETKHMRTNAIVERCLAAVVGAVLLIPTIFFSYRVGQGIYYEYVLFPKEKAEEHYIVPSRWQDFAFQAIFWSAVLILLFISFRLIRFALKSRN